MSGDIDEDATEGKCKIVCLGGSTTDYSFYGINSWPFYLALMLNEQMKGYDIYNGGCYCYTSSQEMLKLIRDILGFMKPDIIISYSGLNDSIGAGHPMTLKLYEDTIEGLRTYYIKNNGEIDEIYYGELQDWVATYINNQRIMHAVCREYNIKYIGILQPSAVTGSYRVNEIDKKFMEIKGIREQLKNHMSFYEDVRYRIKAYPYIHDCTQIFNDKEDMFYEWSHCNEKGNQIIARHIFNIIMKS